MSGNFEEIKNALKVVNSIKNAIEDKNPPTHKNIEVCESYIDELMFLGLPYSAQAVNNSLNRWCELLLDA